ncbi:UDP-galactopyranose mutase [Helicobacter fennelliae]
MKNLIVGAGLSGLVLAERLANVKKEEVILIDRRKSIGGNCVDKNHNGILVHTYGAHIFHTQNKIVWDYLKNFTLFYPYMHKVIGLVSGKLIPIPFNLNSLYMIFPHSLAKDTESTLLQYFGFGAKVSILELAKHKNCKMIADFIYENIFLHYTLKQWQCTPQELDSSVFLRVPIVLSKDDRYFPNDTYQGIPQNGYSAMFEKMIDNPLITLELECEFKSIDVSKFDRIFYSGAIDEYFDYCFGELPYRSLILQTLEIEREYFGQNSVINYPNNYDFTRIIEHKYFLDTKSPHTIITYEYPKSWNLGDERYYPVPTTQSAQIYERYVTKAKELKNTYFIGRLGEYKYYDMDKAIARALEIFASLED